MIQFYKDQDGKLSSFIDHHEKFGSKKCKPEHIQVMTGKADPDDIAADINRIQSGKTVGWRKL